MKLEIKMMEMKRKSEELTGKNTLQEAEIPDDRNHSETENSKLIQLEAESEQLKKEITKLSTENKMLNENLKNAQKSVPKQTGLEKKRYR